MKVQKPSSILKKGSSQVIEEVREPSEREESEKYDQNNLKDDKSEISSDSSEEDEDNMETDGRYDYLKEMALQYKFDQQDIEDTHQIPLPLSYDLNKEEILEAHESSEEDVEAVKQQYEQAKAKSLRRNMRIQRRNPKVPKAKEAFKLGFPRDKQLPKIDEKKVRKSQYEDLDVKQIKNKVAYFQGYIKNLKSRMGTLLSKNKDEIEQDKTKMFLKNYEEDQKHFIKKNNQ